MSLAQSTGTAGVSATRSVRIYSREELVPTLRGVASAIIANGIHWIDPDLFTQAADEIERLHTLAGAAALGPDFATIRQKYCTCALCQMIDKHGGVKSVTYS